MRNHLTADGLTRTASERTPHDKNEETGVFTVVNVREARLLMIRKNVQRSVRTTTRLAIPVLDCDRRHSFSLRVLRPPLPSTIICQLVYLNCDFVS